ncbi:MAG: hypothetical protein Q7T71_19140 [Herbiconiux sp.]|nr:hypothetical protein [Herbiconiux sp.]
MTSEGPLRRTVLAGAWAAPVIIAAVAAPTARSAAVCPIRS